MPISYNEVEKYQILISALKQRNCVLFVGAGLSVGAGIPTWAKLMQDMITDLKAKHDTEALENWFQKGEYQKIAGYYKNVVTDDEYYNFLKREFQVDATPTINHKLIAKLPIACILTTNYDKLIERAFENRVPMRKYNSPDIGQINIREEFYILKCHGDIDDYTTIILAEEDYNNLIHKHLAYKEFLKALLQFKTFLFIGYSLNDLDFKLIRNHLKYAFGNRIATSYALMTGQCKEDITLLENDGFVILTYENLDGEHSEVTEFLKILGDHIVERKSTQVSRIPFKFLDCYYKEDRSWFFGREDDRAVEEIEKAILDQSRGIIQVIGENGVGKTSLIQGLLIPKLEENGEYNCLYFNTPHKIEELRLNDILSQVDPERKTIIFLDHFEKILRQYLSGDKAYDNSIDKWKELLEKKLNERTTVIFISAADKSAYRFGKLFPNAPYPINIERLTDDQLRTAICRPLQKLKSEFNDDVVFPEDLITKLIDLYRKLTRSREDGSYILTYIQAVCYYLIKKRQFDSPKGFEEITKWPWLKEVILDKQIGNIVKNLYHKEDRVILVELIKKMTDEDKPDLLATLDRDSLMKLLRPILAFPEPIDQQ